MQRERGRRGGAENEGDGEEVRGRGTGEWMCSHYTLCSFNFFKGPNPADTSSIHAEVLQPSPSHPRLRINKASTI